MNRIFIFIASVMLSGCATYSFDRIKDKPVAALGDLGVVTIEDVENTFKALHQGHESMLAGEGAIKQSLDRVVNEKYFLLEAYRMGYGEDPEIVEAVNNFAMSKGTEQLFKDEIEGKAVVSGEEVENVYNVSAGYMYMVGLITEYKKEDIENAVKQLEGGEDFRTLAGRVSKDPSAAKGGRLSAVLWGELPPPVSDMVLNMKVGELSRPFILDDKWAIVKLFEKEEKEKKPELKDLEKGIRAKLTKLARQRTKDEFYRYLTKKWNAVVREELITPENLFAEKSKDGEDAVLASFDGGEIKLGEFKKKMDVKKFSSLPAEYSLKKVSHGIEDELLLSLIRKEVVERNYTSLPEIVDQVRMKKNRLVLDKFLADAFSNISASEEEQKAYYEANKEKYRTDGEVFVNVILVEGEEKSQEILKKINSGEDFAAVARAESMDPYSSQFGGEIGWIARKNLDPDAEKTLFSLKPGETATIKMEGKYYVVKVDKIKEPVQKEFIDVKDFVDREVVAKKTATEVQKWLERLKAMNPVAVNEENIDLATRYYRAKVREKEKKMTGGVKHDF